MPSADVTGPELEELHAALLDAFPVKARLEQLVKFEFEVSLASVADGDSLTIVVFRLIEWADANRRLPWSERGPKAGHHAPPPPGALVPGTRPAAPAGVVV